MPWLYLLLQERENVGVQADTPRVLLAQAQEHIRAM